MRGFTKEYYGYMRLIFIRHGEPDYSCDGLTSKGQREAELLSKRVSKWDVDRFYVSPLGRAVATAKPTLDVMDRTAITLPWLREYSYPIINPTHKNESVCWDFIPSDWANNPKMFTMTEWLDIDPASQNHELKDMYYQITNGLDEIIGEYGYHRNGNYYINSNPKMRKITSTVIDNSRHIGNELPNEDAGKTVVFFCHFGVTLLMLSHLLNIPFLALAHGTLIPTTGVTIVTSEERWNDEAYFRLQTLGDMHHLLSNNEPISGAGSFAPLFQG